MLTRFSLLKPCHGQVSTSVRFRSALSALKKALIIAYKKGTTMDDKVFDRHNTTYVKTVPRKGRGVFANIPFKAGDLIERAPTWGFDDAAAKFLDHTGLFQYYFVRHDRHLKGDTPTGYVVFGLISMVNHSFQPNAHILWSDEASGAWASIVAIKDIKVGEEITHRYANIDAYPHTVCFIE